MLNIFFKNIIIYCGDNDTFDFKAHELAYYMWDLLEKWGDCLNSQHRSDGAKIMQILKNCNIPVVSPGKGEECKTHLTEVRA